MKNSLSLKVLSLCALFFICYSVGSYIVYTNKDLLSHDTDSIIVIRRGYVDCLHSRYGDVVRFSNNQLYKNKLVDKDKIENIVSIVNNSKRKDILKFHCNTTMYFYKGNTIDTVGLNETIIETKGVVYVCDQNIQTKINTWLNQR